jgi:hypothetical protein
MSKRTSDILINIIGTLLGVALWVIYRLTLGPFFIHQ